MGDVAELRPAHGQIPPHDLDAEAAVLSAVILNPASFSLVAGLLRARDFYSDANRHIWEAIESLDASGTAIDIVNVMTALRTRNLLQQVGGSPYLSQIIDATPVIANVVDHARTVAARGHQRRLIATFKTLAAEGYGEIGDPVRWGQTAEQRVYEASRFDAHEAADNTMHAQIPLVLDQFMNSSGPELINGVPTGFVGLERTLYRLGRGLVYVVAGRPGMGKTALASQLGTNVASFGHGVVEISMEMPRDQLIARKFSQSARVDFEKLISRQLNAKEWERIATQAKRLQKLPLVVEYLVAPTIAVIRSTIRHARAMLERHHPGVKLGLVSIDYIQKIDPEHRKGETTDNEITRLSQAIAWIAGEFNVAVVEVSQLNRGPEQEPNKEPKLKHLRGSGSLEQDAYAVLFPFRPQYYKTDKQQAMISSVAEDCEIIVAKHRNGKTGRVPMRFDSPAMAFDDRDDGFGTIPADLYDIGEDPS